MVFKNLVFLSQRTHTLHCKDAALNVVCGNNQPVFWETYVAFLQLQSCSLLNLMIHTVQ